MFLLREDSIVGLDVVSAQKKMIYKIKTWNLNIAILDQGYNSQNQPNNKAKKWRRKKHKTQQRNQ